VRYDSDSTPAAIHVVGVGPWVSGLYPFLKANDEDQARILKLKLEKVEQGILKYSALTEDPTLGPRLLNELEGDDDDL
jgi:hypothetical protein